MMSITIIRARHGAVRATVRDEHGVVLAQDEGDTSWDAIGELVMANTTLFNVEFVDKHGLIIKDGVILNG